MSFILQQFDWINPAATIIAALIGAVVAFLIMRPQVKQAKRQADVAEAALEQAKRQVVAAEAALRQADHQVAAAYVEAISMALEGMASDFNVGHIPHAHGHAFVGMIENYRSHIGEYLNDRDIQDLEKFKDLANRADDMDSLLAKDLIPDEVERRRLVEDLRRAAGDLRAKAAAVKVRQPNNSFNRSAN